VDGGRAPAEAYDDPEEAHGFLPLSHMFREIRRLSI
jgi:hypothetical protein